MTDYETEKPTTKDLQAFGALSKAEYARIHAPDVPKWFIEKHGDTVQNYGCEKQYICDEYTHKLWLDYFVSVTVD